MPNKRTYLRDGRAPIPEKESTSVVMSANKGKNTKPELLLRKAIWSNGIRGYRIHWKKVPGKPDICFPGKKLAIFINGCFWHRCPHCNFTLPKQNKHFWKEKFERNQSRDKIKNAELESIQWRVITIWECEIKGKIEECVKMIKEKLNGL
jgi:DNA mismatch endonuclease, patch repair protein